MTLAQIQLRRDTAANWTTANPTLASGEAGVETDKERAKVGNGSTPYTTLPYVGSFTPSGTRASPNQITAVGGITATVAPRQLQFVEGSAGPVVITVNPQISAGDFTGQELILQGTDDTNTVTIANGNGLELNGSCPLRNGSRIQLIWDGTVWGEVARNDI